VTVHSSSMPMTLSILKSAPYSNAGNNRDNHGYTMRTTCPLWVCRQHCAASRADPATVRLVSNTVESTVIWLCHLAAKLIFSNLDYINIMPP
jgi:hypothetical protein